MKQLLIVSLAASLVLNFGCSKPTPEQLFAKAQKDQRQAEAAADTARDPAKVRALFVPSLDAYRELVDTYPRSELAEPSLFMMGTIFNNNTHEYDRAVEAYKKYLDLFPGGKQAQLACFLIGYLYNNELHNLDSAAAAYRRFLDRYPNSEMAASAQFELSTLGKSPDELLPPPARDTVRRAPIAAKPAKAKVRKH